MPVFNQSRSRSIRLIFLVTFLVIMARLFYLQVISGQYGRWADENAILRKTIYPPRGLLFDRKKVIVLNNSVTYDLMVTPASAKGMDTAFFCSLMELDTAEFRKRIITAVLKNGSQKPSVFEASLGPQKYARILENLWRFQSGFYVQERPVRSYPFNAAANILGYLGEVDSNYLRKYADEGYVSGDFAGMTGLEASYEKVLMGERGVQVLIKDKVSRIMGPYKNGAEDKEAVAGNNLYLSLDIELQQLGEKLMNNKVGSIVAIDPKTGGILAMVSSPTFDPAYLSGPERSRHIRDLMYNDPRLPLINRAVYATYSPGSTFKTLQALVGLYEGVITTNTSFACSGAFYGCGSSRPMKCLDPGVFSLRTAITHSCNTYFANVMQRVINNPVFPTQDSSLRSWDNFMYAFGLGRRLGVDIPSEQKGNIPTPEHYDKIYGAGRWNYCTYRSVSIGQGEVSVTPLQVANEMAYIANKGWFITPHLADSIEGEDKFGLLEKYKEKNIPLPVADSIFEAVHDGMQGVMESGTATGARVPGIIVCGKTGTVENYYRGVKQPNHSFFCAFAPRENPKIAIMCVVENSGRYGGTYAAPITSLMIEKYLNDTIAAGRRALEKRMAGISLIPPLMMEKIKERDSLKLIKEEGKESGMLPADNKLTADPAHHSRKINPETGNTPGGNIPHDGGQKKQAGSEILVPDKQRNFSPDQKNSFRIK